ncbi:MAG: hypothetical protein HY290_29740 [Planctomycetia bacterium]|nr:hypothetical protein [Planctomycetia bacterium]
MILADLVRTVGVESFSCAWLAHRHATQTPALDGLTTTRIERRYETAFRPVRGLVGELISATALRALRPAMLRNCTRQVLRLIERQKPDQLLAVLESPAAIQVAARVHRQCGIPLLALVWDDVELFCRQAAFDRWTRRWVHRDFAHVLQNSVRTAVICENMQKAYADRYGISSQIVRHGIPADESPSRDDPEVRTDGPWLVGFAGSVTAPDCLNALVRVLDSMNWRFAGRDIALRLVGARYVLDSRKPQRIEYYGWRSVAETRQLLGECDLLFLPQSFGSELRFFSELSFPTKLSTYVAARRPILLHAPQNASLSAFWDDHDLGPRCNLLDEGAVGSALRRGLEPDATSRANWQRQIAHVHDSVLNVAEFERGVRKLLGVERHSEPAPVIAAAQASY